MYQHIFGETKMTPIDNAVSNCYKKCYHGAYITLTGNGSRHHKWIGLFYDEYLDV